MAVAELLDDPVVVSPRLLLIAHAIYTASVTEALDELAERKALFAAHACDIAEAVKKEVGRRGRGTDPDEIHQETAQAIWTAISNGTQIEDWPAFARKVASAKVKDAIKRLSRERSRHHSADAYDAAGTVRHSLPPSDAALDEAKGLKQFGGRPPGWWHDPYGSEQTSESTVEDALIEMIELCRRAGKGATELQVTTMGWCETILSERLGCETVQGEYRVGPIAYLTAMARVAMQPPIDPEPMLRAVSSGKWDRGLEKTIAVARGHYNRAKQFGEMVRLVQTFDDQLHTGLYPDGTPRLLSAEEYGMLALIAGWLPKRKALPTGVGAVERLIDAARDAAQAALKDFRRDTYLAIGTPELFQPARRGPHAHTKKKGESEQFGASNDSPNRSPECHSVSLTPNQSNEGADL